MRLRARRSPAAERFAAAGLPDPSASWRAAQWCAIDLELTGLHRQDEIIAIGAVPIRAGALILGEAMYTLVRPARPPRHDAILVHKLRAADLERAPSLDTAVDRLLEVMAGRVPVFHTAMVERTFLGRELRRRRLRLSDDADTEVLGRLWLRIRDGVAPAGLPLARLATVLNQPAEDPHHALGDALTTGKAFIALASHLQDAGYASVRALTHAEAAAPRMSGRFGPC